MSAEGFNGKKGKKKAQYQLHRYREAELLKKFKLLNELFNQIISLVLTSHLPCRSQNSDRKL